MGNGVNQFFPGLLKSRVNGISIHDYLSNENLWLEFKYTIVQKVRFDKMFLYSNYLENKNGVSDTDYFLKWNENKDENVGYWLENSNWNRMNEKYNRLMLDTKNVIKFNPTFFKELECIGTAKNAKNEANFKEVFWEVQN